MMKNNYYKDQIKIFIFICINLIMFVAGVYSASVAITKPPTQLMALTNNAKTLYEYKNHPANQNGLK